jgi:hypothetical protein
VCLPHASTALPMPMRAHDICTCAAVLVLAGAAHARLGFRVYSRSRCISPTHGCESGICASGNFIVSSNFRRTWFCGGPVTVGQHSGDSWRVDLFKGQYRFHVKIYEYTVSTDPPFKT